MTYPTKTYPREKRSHAHCSWAQKVRLMTGLVFLTALVSACTPTDNPRLAMCQKIVNNMVGSIDSWSDPNISEGGKQMVIKADFKTSSGDAGEVNCMFKRDQNGNNSETADFRTSPSTVAINGRQLSNKELMTASLAATGEQIKGLAAETTKQTKKLAAEAEQKGEELTAQAEELAGKAGELAKKASDAALDAANETSKKVQEALQQ